MNKRNDITPYIAVKDGALTIAACVTALQQVFETVIVGVDTNTKDNTEEICRNLGAVVIPVTWTGFAQTKNFIAAQASTDWVLSMDADEVLNQELMESLFQVSLQPNVQYAFNRMSYVGTVAFRHSGWHPDWVTRLYNRYDAKWNTNLVHEGLMTDQLAHVVKLNGLVHHYSYTDFDQVYTKFDIYARLRAMEWTKSGKKPYFIKKLFGPTFRFFKTFILRRGFLDGSNGLKLAKAEYWLKRKEMEYFDKLQK
ncbi:MAG: glycosyltransferase family 2 protein [Saprospiraceae bacterium]